MCCDNPSCGRKAEKLDCKGLKKCRNCEAATYCSIECQSLDWARHKLLCREIELDEEG